MRLASTDYRMRSWLVIVALTILFCAAGIRSVAAACGEAPGVTTDRFDYGPSDIVTISGAGFECGAVLAVLVTAPDNSTFSGDGAGSAGPDFVVSDDNGGFTLSYHLSGMIPAGDVYVGQVGTYQVNVLDTNGTLMASTAFTDGQGNHSCVVMTSGGVKCWGSNGYGQLGDGTGTDRSTPVNVIAFASGVAQVSLGFNHSCVLTTNGGVKCWGGGKLGDGNWTPGTATPVDVSGLTSGVIQIGAGGTHTCAVTAVGGVKCWGYNPWGQLGDGTNDDRSKPVDVSGLTDGVVQVSASAYNTCALTTSGGVKCWGENGSGQLGDDTYTRRLTPVNVSGLTSGVAQVRPGGNHTCAVTTGGGVKCWGDNQYGQLGDGTFTRRPKPVDVIGLTSGVIQISGGGSHTCAVTTVGGVKCWGYNPYGQLGDGTFGTRRNTPADVTDLTSGVTQVRAGENHSCALTAAGGVKCWGYNAWGQLGDNSKDKRLKAVDVIGLASGVTQLWDSGSLITDSDAPVASPTQLPAANADGWNNTDVIVSWNWTDTGGSGVDSANCTVSSTSSREGRHIELSGTCRDLAGNSSEAAPYVISVDKTAPTITAAATTLPNGADWYNGDVIVAFTCADALSGLGSACPADQTLSAEGAEVASSAQVVIDAAGNTSAASNVVTVQIDKTPPSVALSGGPAGGGTYYFGVIPLAPTCSASDALSGVDGICTVSGYSTGAGPHTVVATVKDRAGNQNSTSVTYTVLPWTLSGFYQPLDMGDIWNTVRNGATVPIKFEVFAGSAELTDTSVVVQPLTATQALCTGGPTDDIDLVATGGTSLRYDATAGQFVYNWQTPKNPGYCYVVTVTLADGTSRSANIKLK